MSRNDDYKKGNLLDFSYHQIYYKLIDLDLSRQTNTNILQIVHFVEKLEKENGTNMVLIAEKQRKQL